MEVDGIPIRLHRGDLAADVQFTGTVAIDTETMGLNPHRDRLCLVQLYDGRDQVHLVQFPWPAAAEERRRPYRAPNLAAMLADETVTKLFHFARFDVAVLDQYLGVACRPIYCTKIASRLVRTYTDRHSLKELCRELLGKDLAKEQQSSDWGRNDLTDAQMRYAASDVIHLHALRDRLNVMLDRVGRRPMAEACFQFLPVRARLDLDGWPDQDIFAH
ncbi:MAG: ribonuclease H-like domain-containing protein [Rhodospirillales bacterium]|nr:ribonuclease H-like domain-containing protein [Rhodospirillales bacterium]